MKAEGNQVENLGYALWWVPAEPGATGLGRTLSLLAERFSGPKFEPHVTLLSGFPDFDSALDTAERISRRIAPIGLKANGLAEGAEYFRSLYMTFEENAALQSARTHAMMLSGVSDAETYVPHLSLLYGVLTNAERHAARVLVAGQLPSEILLDAIEVWELRGPVPEWAQQGHLAL